MPKDKQPIFWPTKQGEGKIFCLMSLMIFFTLLSASLLKPLKESHIVMTIGAEYVVFLKTISIIPLILAGLLYIKFFRAENMLKLSYYMIALFCTFFLVHAFILFPNYDMLHFSGQSADSMKSFSSLDGYIKIGNMWVASLYFIFQDLWQVMISSMIFWHFANFISTMEQAKRHYPFYMLIGGMGFGIGGFFIYQMIDFYTNIVETHHYTLKMVSITVALCGTMVGFLLKQISAMIAENKAFQNIPQNFVKEEGAFLQDIKHIFKSRYIWLIIGINFCFGYIVNTCSLIWRSELRQYVSSASEYSKFIGIQLMKTGFASTISLIVIIFLLRRLSWRKSAIFAPTLSIIVGAALLIFTIFGFDLEHIIFIGSIYFILSKSIVGDMNYLTRELAYIPLQSFALKGKGRALLEIIILGIAKSAAVLVPVSMLTLYPNASIKDIVPALGAIFILIAIFWIKWVCGLNKEIQKLAPGE